MFMVPLVIFQEVTILASSASGPKKQKIGCGAHKIGEVSIIASSVSGLKIRKLAAALTVLVKCFF